MTLATRELVQYANEMEQRAEQLQNKAEENKKNTGAIVEESIAKLRNAVSGEMDENRKIADALYAETERFV